MTAPRRTLFLLIPLVSLSWTAPLAVATWRNNVNPHILIVVVPFVLGLIAYPGYAMFVVTSRASWWTRISLLLGLTAAISGLGLVLVASRDLLASPRLLPGAVLRSWPSGIALIACPLLAICFCVTLRWRLLRDAAR